MFEGQPDHFEHESSHSDPSTTMRFDARYRAKTAELLQAIKGLTDVLVSHERSLESRRRARRREDAKKLGDAVEALACNLILLAATGPASKLAVPRSHAFIWQGATNSSPVYGAHFLQAIDLMASRGLIEEGKRGFRISDTHKRPSLIWPTPALSKFLPLTPPDWRSIEEIDSQQPIVLKARKIGGQGAVVPFAETARTKRYARQVAAINRNLREADINITGLGETLSLDRDGQIVAPYRRFVQRIFNNSSWEAGGRLFGGFWMSMRREDRKYIRIDGEEIAAPDYRQLFARLAYVIAGFPEAEKENDLYDIAGDGSSRAGWKKLVSAMLFAEKPLRAWPKGTKRLFPAGTELGNVRRMLLDRHAPIAHLFGTGLGFRLMWIESEILIDVVTRLASIGVSALPLHDAVLVAKSKAGLAADVMRQSFKHKTGSSGAIGF
jgi:hypothetical protein